MDLLRKRLIEEARRTISNDDPSHDIDHALRVLANAEHISSFEGGNLKVIIPAALLHDAVNYQKDDPKSENAAEESAKVARRILESFPQYNENEIMRVEEAVAEHPYDGGIKPKSPESKILQDADRLEATGAIAIMRTFCSTGQMKRRFYNPNDPFCEKRKPDSLLYALDLFYKRLVKVGSSMNTETARKLAEERTRFTYAFLEQLKDELAVSSGNYAQNKN
jgi:uncharacterized protein